VNVATKDVDTIKSIKSLLPSLFQREDLLIIFQYPTVSAVGFPPTPLWKRGARGDFKIKKVYLKIPRCLCSGEFSFPSLAKRGWGDFIEFDYHLSLKDHMEVCRCLKR
jgi:hypothetical protein